MLQYVNSFSCAAESKGNAIIIQFKQNEPDFHVEDKERKTTTETHDISSLIMDNECAQRLLEALSHILSEEESKCE